MVDGAEKGIRKNQDKAGLGFYKPSPRPPQPRARYSTEHRVMVEILVAARNRAGLSQAALAEKLGKVQSHVAFIETFERDLTAVELYRWCQATGVPFTDFAERFEEALKQTLQES